jgi:MoaA/NifB/PqqE/SkfB family radical SAM enzyme
MRVYAVCLRWLFTRQKNLSCNFCAFETQDKSLPVEWFEKQGYRFKKLHSTKPLR